MTFPVVVIDLFVTIGRQHLGAMFNLIAYYVLALPLGISLAFRFGLGLQGLWIGMCRVLDLGRHCCALVGAYFFLRPGDRAFYCGHCRIRCGVAWHRLGA